MTKTRRERIGENTECEPKAMEKKSKVKVLRGLSDASKKRKGILFVTGAQDVVR